MTLFSHTQSHPRVRGVCEVRECAEFDFVMLWGQVYKISIGAACRLSWPADRLVIQVLDDSTDLVIKVFIILGVC